MSALWKLCSFCIEAMIKQGIRIARDMSEEADVENDKSKNNERTTR